MFSAEIKKKVGVEYLTGISTVKIQRRYGIKGSATIGEWLRLFEQFGLSGLENHWFSKTFVPYSFKINVIRWRQANNASFPITARHFKIRNPSQIWQWERALIAGRLHPDQGRPSTMTKSHKKENDVSKKNKALEEENEFLRLRVAYLEKVRALTQKKESQTKKRPK